APHGLRPGDVAAPARHDVHVQLWHDVADRGDVELVAAGQRFQRGGDAADLDHQGRLLMVGEIDDLANIGPPGHQDQPGKVRVVHDEDARQRQVANRRGILLQPWMQRESVRHRHPPEPAWRPGRPNQRRRIRALSGNGYRRSAYGKSRYGVTWIGVNSYP